MAPRVAFHIGYHKTATTWFQRVALPRHPDIHIFLTQGFARDPFLRDIVFTPDRSFDAGHAKECFDRQIAELGVPDDGVVVVSEERLSGHAATGGFDAFRIAERLAQVVPDAKVFCGVREQLSMIESEYLQLLQEGSLARLNWLLDFEPLAASLPGFDLGHYEYDALADHYAELFGPGHVRLFEFSAMTGNPRGYLDEVSGFLEIDRWPALTDEELSRRVNRAVPRRLLGLRRFLNHFERRPLNPHPVVAFPPFWRGPLWWCAARLPARKRGLLDRAAQDRLRERYRDSNQRLAQRYGVEFPT